MRNMIVGTRHKPKPYMDVVTGDLVMATPRQAAELPDNYKPVETGVGEDGKPFMRVRVAVGKGVIATVDISEADPQEVPEDGKRKTS